MKRDIAYKIFDMSENNAYSINAVKKMYRKLCLRYHPDKKYLDKQMSHLFFIMVNEAYLVIINDIEDRQVKSESFLSSGDIKIDEGIVEITNDIINNKSLFEVANKFGNLLEKYKHL